MKIAYIIKESFLKQNSYSIDAFCPLHKTVGMMKWIITFFDSAKKWILDSKSDKKISWALI